MVTDPTNEPLPLERRTYNQWVNTQTLEDYALRYTAQRGRRWSDWRIANTALGAASFLACEAIGGTITLQFGFYNAILAIAAGMVIFLVVGAPIAICAAREGLDIDLLTRGAGFGYLGSTVTSLIYASFTFLLFAVEASIMALAITLATSLPIALSYVISALGVLPVALHGMKAITRMQIATQPIWLFLQFGPLVYLFFHWNAAIAIWTGPDGMGHATQGNLIFFGLALSTILSLLPQIGEQADYLRFLRKPRNRTDMRWWVAVLVGGPGWGIIGGLKLAAGSFLVMFTLTEVNSVAQADSPPIMYTVLFQEITGSPGVALALMLVFVVICQMKINVTNVYAGSLAWSNFFARLTHAHPGRVVWLVFNALLALLIMETGVIGATATLLALYANLASGWIGALSGDLMISKPLGLSPKQVEFRRAYLYDVNPVGVGAMALSFFAASVALTDVVGTTMQAFAPVLGLIVAFVCAPIIAWITKGRFYIARTPTTFRTSLRCTACDIVYEAPDMVACPFHRGPVCSLCCTLENRCHDQCKENSDFIQQARNLLRRISPRGIERYIGGSVAHFLVIMLAFSVTLAVVFYWITFGEPMAEALRRDLVDIFVTLEVLAGIVAWLFVLAHDSRCAAERETRQQTDMLRQEVAAHIETDAALQKARDAAESANAAKTRYLVAVSHEIRSPLNAIYGYAQLLERGNSIEPTEAGSVIRQSAEHLTNLVEGLLEISRVESGVVELRSDIVPIESLLHHLVTMFRMQAAAKGITLGLVIHDRLPHHVKTDEKRFRQILINLISNAVKYTARGGAVISVWYRSEVVRIEISDTGPGIAATDLERIFEPFERGTSAEVQREPGIGLGLSITRVLTRILGGDITAESVPGQGSMFRLRMMLPAVHNAIPATAYGQITGFHGRARHVLVIDDDTLQRNFLDGLLTPLGFIVHKARHGAEAQELAISLGSDLDLALLDIQLPGESGWDVASRLRSLEGAGLRIVMVSANAGEFSTGGDGRAVHDGFVTKPVDVDALLAMMARLLELEWIRAAMPENPSVRQPRPDLPIRALSSSLLHGLSEIRRAAKLGHVRAVETSLAQLVPITEEDRHFLKIAREHLETFDLKSVVKVIDDAAS
ncbi:hybrid sensor histidine kinase/response regulator [Komagataeibacter europaeus]|uniref:hybrid sensor histidine kinase/response regulator n=1 Tax=Komagataeibacter europaeus TaxID=33995 RepID=UPI0015FCD566|nr:ATP-binding protein [Komagataeibacter europaeus]